MADQRRAGPITVKSNGEIYDAVGSWTYNAGGMKRTAIVAADGRVLGYKEEPQAPFIEGDIIDSGTLSLIALINIKDATIMIELANGKTFTLYQAWFAGEGSASTEEAKIPVRFEGMRAQESPAAG